MENENKEIRELLEKIDEYKKIADEAIDQCDEAIEVLSEALEEEGWPEEAEAPEDPEDGADWIIIF